MYSDVQILGEFNDTQNDGFELHLLEIPPTFQIVDLSGVGRVWQSETDSLFEYLLVIDTTIGLWILAIPALKYPAILSM